MKKYVFETQYKLTKYQRKYFMIKRYLDILLAIIMMILLWPVMVFAALCIRLESKGPVIFKQRRPGYHQRIFTIYKFRSMRIELFDKNGKALSDKERETRVGRFLRQTSLDELPQLINILKGEMSFIGPRPFLVNDLGSYNEEQLIRFLVLPGMTSWTAVHGRNRITIIDKYNYEIYYVKNFGFWIDIKIFFSTFILVMKRTNVVDDVTGGRIGAEIVED